MATTPPEELLDIYFVVEPRLDDEYYFSRLRRLPLARRRALVIHELKHHRDRTQAGLIQVFKSGAVEGRAWILNRNYLGNFMVDRATRVAIPAAASGPSSARSGSMPRSIESCLITHPGLAHAI